MGYGDWIFLGILLIVAALGALLGFGKTLKFITGGIVGIIISFLLCYCFGGVIMQLPFVSGMLRDLAAHWSHIGWLTAMHLEIIIYYIALFIITMVLRIIIVLLLKGVVETKVLVMQIINRVLGAVLLSVLFFLLMFFVFQIIGWIGGGTERDFYNAVALNANAIVRPLYDWNPMNSIVIFIKGIFVR